MAINIDRLDQSIRFAHYRHGCSVIQRRMSPIHWQMKTVASEHIQSHIDRCPYTTDVVDGETVPLAS